LVELEQKGIQLPAIKHS